MKLGDAQELFSECLGKLITFAYAKGYKIRMGDVQSFQSDKDILGTKPRHKRNSQHYKKLAGDVNLFKDGKFLVSSEEHRELGEYWESLSPFCRWGGRYGDGNHYELMEDGWR